MTLFKKFFALFAASVVACFLCASALRADANWKPWDPHAAQIKQVVQHDIPAYWLPAGKTVFIETVSPTELNQAILFCYQKDESQKRSGGLYLPKPGPFGTSRNPPEGRIVLVRDGMESDFTRMVVTHELGHAFYFEWMPALERADYRKCWQLDCRAGHLPTLYARQNEYEGFAETFVAYIDHRNTLSPRTLHFMRHLDNQMFQAAFRHFQQSPPGTNVCS